VRRETSRVSFLMCPFCVRALVPSKTTYVDAPSASIPPPSRNHRTPTAADTPAAAGRLLARDAASIARQNRCRPNAVRQIQSLQRTQGRSFPVKGSRLDGSQHALEVSPQHRVDHGPGQSAHGATSWHIPVVECDRCPVPVGLEVEPGLGLLERDESGCRFVVAILRPSSQAVTVSTNVPTGARSTWRRAPTPWVWSPMGRVALRPSQWSARFGKSANTSQTESQDAATRRRTARCRSAVMIAPGAQISPWPSIAGSKTTARATCSPPRSDNRCARQGDRPAAARAST
jgi:hypothetical protein